MTSGESSGRSEAEKYVKKICRVKGRETIRSNMLVQQISTTIDITPGVGQFLLLDWVGSRGCVHWHLRFFHFRKKTAYLFDFQSIPIKNNL
jgi:hypothetical protein